MSLLNTQPAKPNGSHHHYSSFVLRETLVSKARYHKTRYKSLQNLPASPLSVYQYYVKRYLTVQLILLDLETFYPEQFLCRDTEQDYFEPLLYKIISADINRICVEAACCAWLSWDSAVITGLEDLKHELPECLSYGLVLEYPSPILRAASFLAGFTKREELFSLPEHVHNQADLFALQQLRDLFPDLTQEDYKSLIDPYRNRVRKHIDQGMDPSHA